MDIQNNQKTVNKMAIASPYISITTLYLNRFNFLVKRYRMAEQITNKIQLHAAYNRLALALKTESKGIAKDISLENSRRLKSKKMKLDLYLTPLKKLTLNGLKT